MGKKRAYMADGGRARGWTPWPGHRVERAVTWAMQCAGPRHWVLSMCALPCLALLASRHGFTPWRVLARAGAAVRQQVHGRDVTERLWPFSKREEGMSACLGVEGEAGCVERGGDSVRWRIPSRQGPSNRDGKVSSLPDLAGRTGEALHHVVGCHSYRWDTSGPPAARRFLPGGTLSAKAVRGTSKRRSRRLVWRVLLFQETYWSSKDKLPPCLQRLNRR